MPGARRISSLDFSVGLHERHARQLALRDEARPPGRRPSSARSRSRPVSISRASSRRDAGARFHRVDVDRFETSRRGRSRWRSPRVERAAKRRAKRRLSPSAPYNRRDAALRRAGERRRHRRQEPGAVARPPRPARSRCAARRPRPRGERRARLRAQRRLGRAAAAPQGLGRASPPTRRRRCTTWSCAATRAAPRSSSRPGSSASATLAVITDAAALEHELDAAMRFAPHVTRVDADVAATLVAHCEGRAAATLRRARRRLRAQRLRPEAIAARLVATLPHRHVARQWFRSPDVLALLPFDRPEAERSYALVWSLPASAPMRCWRCDAGGVRAPSSPRRPAPRSARCALGSERAAWPLVVGGAATWCGPGWVLRRRRRPRRPSARRPGPQPRPRRRRRARPPSIAEREPWRGVGDERLLRRYVRQRAAPTWAMTRITDGLLRLFAEPSAPIRELRNNGMSLVNRVAPLKRWLTARALDS